MLPESIALGQLLAPVASGLAVVVLYHYLGAEYLGAEENKYWNELRRKLLTSSSSQIREETSFAVTTPAHDYEHVATLNKDVTSQDVAKALESRGYVQGVLSALKYRPPTNEPMADDTYYEIGSMVHRESKSDLLSDSLALRQVHTFWFETDEGIEVYAHEEYSSLNPLVAWMHYRAITQNAQKGIDRVTADLKAADLL